VKRFGYVLITVLVFVFALSTCCGCGSDDSEAVSEDSAEAVVLLSPEQQQEAVLGYIQALLKYDDESHKLFSNYLKSVDDYFKFKTDTFFLIRLLL